MAKFNVFFKYDLKNGYHSGLFKEREILYTAFEANDYLNHLNSILIGLTNVVFSFQRAISIISYNEQENTFVYMNDVIIRRKRQ